MTDLAQYLKLIVEPTFDEFSRNPASIRHAFLACLVTYHVIDRAAFPKKPGNLRKQWGRESLEFKLIDIIAHHFKHIKSDDEKITRRGAIPISFALGFGQTGEGLELRNLYFVLRDAIKFLHRKAAL